MTDEERLKAAEWFGNRAKNCPMTATRRMFEIAAEALEESTAQPEVVRCQDCKHREAETGFCKGRGWPMQLVPDDGFCEKGERSMK